MAVVLIAGLILQLAADLEREGKLAEVGSIAYLIECVDAAEAARRPGEIIEELAVRAAEELVARREHNSTQG